MKKIIFLAIAAVIFCTFTACKSKKEMGVKAEAKNEITAQNSKVKIVATEITDKYWKLVELNGVPVESAAHIIFKADGTVSGNFGCNNFYGVFVQETGNRIKFDKLVNTQKMCIDTNIMNVEQEFSRVLQIADNYNLTEKQLVLNRARMAPLARFEVE